MKQEKGGRAEEQKLIINRDSDTPFYTQLADLLCRQIMGGKYRPGEKLPTESRLTEIFSVSPMTARRAVGLLASQGIVTSIRGSGTFVKQIDISSASFFLKDFKEVSRNKSSTRIKLLEVRFKKSDGEIAEKLNIEAGERVIFIRRVLFSENEPVFYHRGYLINDPHRPIVEAELDATDLNGLFQGSNHGLIKHGELFLKATLLDAEEASILNVKLPAAGMRLEHVFYDFSDKPIGWGWFICTPSRMHLHTLVGMGHIDGRNNERI